MGDPKKDPPTVEDVEWWATAFESKLRELVEEDVPMEDVVKRCKASATLRFRNMRRRIEKEVPDQPGPAKKK